MLFSTSGLRSSVVRTRSMIAVTWSSRARISACASTPLMLSSTLPSSTWTPTLSLTRSRTSACSETRAIEVVELEVDLVDLDDGDVDDDVGLVGVADFARIDDRVVLVHLLRARSCRRPGCGSGSAVRRRPAFFLPVFLRRAFVACRCLRCPGLTSFAAFAASKLSDFELLRSLLRWVCCAITHLSSVSGSSSLKEVFPVARSASARRRRSARREPSAPACVVLATANADRRDGGRSSR